MSNIDPTNSPPQQLTEIQSSWLEFIASLRVYLVVQTDDRPLDQFLSFRDSVLKLVQSTNFLNQFESAWGPLTNMPSIRNALLMELGAFKYAAEVSEATEKQGSEASKNNERIKKLLDKASTIVGSVKDLLNDLPPEAKMAITLLGELIDLFKGKGK